jgi:hypothetical protein
LNENDQQRYDAINLFTISLACLNRGRINIKEDLSKPCDFCVGLHLTGIQETENVNTIYPQEPQVSTPAKQ